MSNLRPLTTERYNARLLFSEKVKDESLSDDLRGYMYKILDNKVDSDVILYFNNIHKHTEDKDIIVASWVLLGNITGIDKVDALGNFI